MKTENVRFYLKMSNALEYLVRMLRAMPGNFDREKLACRLEELAQEARNFMV